jgi:hypothetical protein
MDISCVDTSAKDAAESGRGMLDSNPERRVPQNSLVPTAFYAFDKDLSQGDAMFS